MAAASCDSPLARFHRGGASGPWEEGFPGRHGLRQACTWCSRAPSVPSALQAPALPEGPMQPAPCRALSQRGQGRLSRALGGRSWGFEPGARVALGPHAVVGRSRPWRAAQHCRRLILPESTPASSRGHGCTEGHRLPQACEQGPSPGGLQGTWAQGSPRAVPGPSRRTQTWGRREPHGAVESPNLSSPPGTPLLGAGC